MVKKLKQILLNIARLTSMDKQWILRRLSNSQMETLEKWQGLQLLDEAERFRALKAPHSFLPREVDLQLPIFCQQLAVKTPLYAAIVIYQGSYVWQELFLQEFDHCGDIKRCLKNQVTDIKPAAQRALFNEWERVMLHTLSDDCDSESNDNYRLDGVENKHG